MKLKLLIMALAVVFHCKAGKFLTLSDISGSSYMPDSYSSVRPLNDGESYACISDDSKQIVRYSFQTGKKLSVLFDVAKAEGSSIKKIDGYILSPNESVILIQTETSPRFRRSKKAVYYIYDVKNGTLVPLSKGGPQEQPIFSPDGHVVAFARDNNLFLVKLLFNNSESQVTKDGQPNAIINGIPDWVNEEEFSTARSFDFSADSKMLAWVRYDETHVPQFSIPLYKGMKPEKQDNALYPGQFVYKYPKAGQPNSKVSVQTYDIKSHVIRTMDLPMDTDSYVPRIKFTSVPDQLAIVTLNRHQNQMNLFIGNARSRVCRLALKEESEHYIREDSYQQLSFSDNHFAMLSDRSGYRHLYWFSSTGQLLKQITSGKNEVVSYYGYDPLTRSFYYSAYDGSPLRTAVFRTDMNGKTKKLTTTQGDNSAIFSKSYKYFLHTCSSLTTPPVTSLCNKEGKTITTLVDNSELKNKLSQVAMPVKEIFSFRTSEGVELNGWMMKPSDFQPDKKYPVVLYQYSGPGSQEVKDSWDAGFLPGGLFESYLNSMGIIVVCVDGRGTGGRGAAFEQSTYLHLGQLESRDQVETALYLGTLPYIDKNNIGIWGWSYGGFNTLMSMSEGRPVFKCGVAVAPPTDWRFYDTVYTERYMRTPGENGEGYNLGPLHHADQLQGHLLLCHGTADDNVHYQNTAEYAEALVQAGKDFDMQIYTNRNHSIRGGNTRTHLFQRIASFFQNQFSR